MIEVRHLFPKLNDSLIELLRGLERKQWESSTVCKGWTVKDIAAHLLDTCLRRLSAGRDGYTTPAPVFDGYGELVTYLNSLNASWVEAYRRVSPAVLIQQMEEAQKEFYEYLTTLDPLAPALFPVAWAGEEQSKNWFDIAREYTERFLHQQQIRQAVGIPGLLNRELYFPFLDTLMLGLPHTYNIHQRDAAVGSRVRVDIIGPAGGSWEVEKGETGWFISTGGSDATAQVYIDEQIAWLLFSKGVDILEARQFWQVLGDPDLGSSALRMTSVMA